MFLSPSFWSPFHLCGLPIPSPSLECMHGRYVLHALIYFFLQELSQSRILLFTSIDNLKYDDFCRWDGSRKQSSWEFNISSFSLLGSLDANETVTLLRPAIELPYYTLQEWRLFAVIAQQQVPSVSKMEMPVFSFRFVMTNLHWFYWLLSPGLACFSSSLILWIVFDSL